MSDDVLLDLRQARLRAHRATRDQVWAIICAGCQIKLPAQLERQSNVTLPSLAHHRANHRRSDLTGTHGSGKASMSHYIERSGWRRTTIDREPVVKTIADGDELRPARCSLGCLGVILSASFRTLPLSMIEEHFRGYTDFDDVLTAESNIHYNSSISSPGHGAIWPITGGSAARRSRLAALYRAYWFLTSTWGCMWRSCFWCGGSAAER